MSTPTLRTVARAGVDISGAGYTEMAFPCLDLGPFLIHSVSLVLTSVPVYRLQQCYRWIPCLLSTCARLVLLISLWRSANDERCFILKMMAKMIAMYVGLTFPLVVIFQIASSRNEWIFFGITVFIMIVHSIMVGSACCLHTGSTLSALFGYSGGSCLHPRTDINPKLRRIDP